VREGGKKPETGNLRPEREKVESGKWSEEKRRRYLRPERGKGEGGKNLDPLKFACPAVASQPLRPDSDLSPGRAWRYSIETKSMSMLCSNRSSEVTDPEEAVWFPGWSVTKSIAARAVRGRGSNHRRR
jgi:hypothetical protein